MKHIKNLVIKFYEDYPTFVKIMEHMRDANIIKEFKIIDEKQHAVHIQGPHNWSCNITKDTDPLLTMSILALTLYGNVVNLMPDKHKAFEELKAWREQYLKKHD